MFKNACTFFGFISAIAGAGGGGWWYLAATETRYQVCNWAIASATASDAQRIIDNQNFLAKENQEQLRAFATTLQTEIHRLNTEVRRLTDARITEFRQAGAQLHPADKKEFMDKLEMVQRAAEASTIQNQEHYDRGVQIERMNNKWATVAIGAALALCAFARLVETTTNEAIPQMVAIGATWSIYCLIITNVRIEIEYVCLTVFGASVLSVVCVKLWKNHGNAIKAAIREIFADEKRTEVPPPAPRETAPVADLMKLQAEAKARQELMDAVHRRSDALLREAELARGPAPPPYTGPVHAHMMGHPHMRHTGYQPEYPQFQDFRGQTFTPRGYPS